MATIYSFRTNTYARNIYLYGNYTFAQMQTDSPDYVVSVKTYVAGEVGKSDKGQTTLYTRETLSNALNMHYITQQEYDDTIALIPVQ